MIGPKVLLVDDEVAFTSNLSKLLGARGYQVTAVDCGDTAVQELQRQDYDVVVLDLNMPGMDGLTTLKAINKLNLFTQVLILTGAGSLNTTLEALNLGACDYLSKPCDIGELVVKIDWACRKKEYAAQKNRNPQNL